jgi:hypothetical protein
VAATTADKADVQIDCSQFGLAAAETSCRYWGHAKNNLAQFQRWRGLSRYWQATEKKLREARAGLVESVSTMCGTAANDAENISSWCHSELHKVNQGSSCEVASLGKHASWRSSSGMFDALP